MGETILEKTFRNSGYRCIGLILLGILSLTIQTSALAADRDVCPTCTYTTIQSAITAAGSGDRIRVAQGVHYASNVNITGSKILTLSGGWSADFTSQTNDPTLTTIDGDSLGRILYVSGFPSKITIENITFQKGKTGLGEMGGCISVRAAWGPLDFNMRDVIVQDCDAAVFGGGISLLGFDTLTANLTNVVLRRNHAKSAGGGISIVTDGYQGPANASAKVYILNALFYGNTSEREGGGVQIWAEEKCQTKVFIINSTITGNKSINQHLGGGVAVVGDTDPDSTSVLEMYNSILYGNQADYGADLAISLYGTQSYASIDHSNVNEILTIVGTLNQSNTLNTDPLFVDPINNDYRLQPTSPNIDAGTEMVPVPPGLPLSDFEGDNRRIDGDQDGTDTVDIGADELIPTNFTHLTLLSPNGGETIPSGSIYRVKWGAPSDAEKFKVQYSGNNGNTWKDINPSTTEKGFDWKVPKPLTNKEKCLIRVIGYDSSNSKIGSDKSVVPFLIEVLRLTSPTGGEVLTSKMTHAINWKTHYTKRKVAKVRLFFSKNGGATWKSVGKTTGDPGTLAWEVPTVKKTNTQCKVKVQLQDEDGNILGEVENKEFFTIQPAP